GGSVYALMNNGNGTDDKGGAANGATPTRTPTAISGVPEPGATTPSAPAPAGRAVPTGYLGTWGATIDNATGTNLRRLTIRQGRGGGAVLMLVAGGPAEGGGSYHCVFAARLVERPGAGGPLQIGPSTVTSGEPASFCTPGEA